ncbi:putative serine threonine protein kinase domain protein [Erysiphe necator]|uniref:Putative serine threonine protein kinase domain protein n=1 Tax=Uncinula necator TaxID=52586 RepID=A0A0B1PD51_UNCNE|nr:putative serine threonine protein kinase domain protein [Erysiphe necator]
MDECWKKKRAEKEQNKSKILSVNRPDDSLNFQLDTAVDSHVSGNLNDFSSYSKSLQTIGVAGGGQVNTEGYSDIYLSTSVVNLKY